jgi:hypothetical protein
MGRQMGAAFEELLRAVADAALPAEEQLALFAHPDTASTELLRRLEDAHARADISRAEGLAPAQRQALDELAYVALSAGPWMDEETDEDYFSDRFLRESWYWVQLRALAREVQSVLGRSAGPGSA